MAETQRYAVVVMHGIGEQKRYATLDGFARGCYDAMVRRGWTVQLSSHTRVRKGDRRQTHVHADVNTLENREFVAEFYEYYWASLTKGRIVWTRVVSWLRKSALAPIGQISFNLAAMQRASEEPGSTVPRARMVWALVRELFRFVLFIAAFLGLLALPVLAAKEWTDIKEELNTSYLAVLPNPGVRLTVGVVVMVLGLVAVWSAYRLWRDRTRWARTEYVVLASVSFLVGVGLAIAGWVIAMPFADFNSEFWDELRIFWVPGLLLVLTVLLAAVLRGFLVNRIGDIALFVDSDERSDLYDTRKLILDGAERELRDLLCDAEVRRVYLVGHSLGSVVALSAIDRLIRRARVTEGDPHSPDMEIDDRLTEEQLAKVEGLVTFGSPLDKVFYFFHRAEKKDRAVRAQILDLLHGFRRLDPPVDYEPYVFADDEREDPARRLEDMPWQNYYSPLDPISGRLDFYRPVENIRLWTGHSGYWTMPDFYDSILDGWWVSRAGGG